MRGEPTCEVSEKYPRQELNEPPETLEIRKSRGGSLHNPVQSIEPTPIEIDLLTLTLEAHRRGDIVKLPEVAPRALPATPK